MNRIHLRIGWRLLLISCLLAGLGGLFVLFSGVVVAQAGCSSIYRPGNGWEVKICATDPEVTTPMNVVLNGVPQGQAALLQIHHQSEHDSGIPEVTVIYTNGFIRLKQNADPMSPIPFGSSFVLGPAYWPNASTYHHHPQLTQLALDTSWLPTGPLRMQAEGTNHALAVSYQLTLPPPRDRQTRLHVTQTYTATTGLTIDSTRRAQTQGFKLVQISSMFINQGGACDGGHTDCHDSNAARFIGSDLARHQVGFASITPSSFIFSSTTPLSSPWLDALHTDNQGWQGNTPNVRIALDALPTNHTITPQGWIRATTNPNDDNVGLWLHDDGPASQNWAAGQSGQISYWLLAQDDPPEPWHDLELRSGFTFLDFEGSYNCSTLVSGPGVTASVIPIAGYTDTALQLNYNLGSNNGRWAQIRCDFAPPLNLSAYDHFRLDWRGKLDAANPELANSLEVVVIDRQGNTEHTFIRDYRHVTQRGWWGQLVVPFDFLDNTIFNPAEVVAFAVSVKKNASDNDIGGVGSIAIDNLTAYNLTTRPIPSTFDSAMPNFKAAGAAVDWLASQQQPIGLLKSWQDEDNCLAHTYDQALALIVFANEGRGVEADGLVGALTALQNGDGSWFQTHKCNTNPPQATTNNKWEGDVAWFVYALSRYLILGGSHPQAEAARNKGATWLAGQVKLSSGCVVDDKNGQEISTEGTIDVWWALQAAGSDFVTKAELVKNCLLTDRWDEAMGFFKGGKNDWKPYLDNQTWGAAFLKAIGEEQKARRALSYAQAVLRLPSQGGQLFGFDGNAGPWSVWNEGTAQYIAVGGDGANDLLLELLAQQQADGAMPGSPDDFRGGGVWTTRWRGVAPTAWLYNALCGEPFHPPDQKECRKVWLPVIFKRP